MQVTGHDTFLNTAAAQWEQHVATKTLENSRLVAAAGDDKALSVDIQVDGFVGGDVVDRTYTHPGSVEVTHDSFDFTSSDLELRGIVAIPYH